MGQRLLSTDRSPTPRTATRRGTGSWTTTASRRSDHRASPRGGLRRRSRSHAGPRAYQSNDVGGTAPRFRLSHCLRRTLGRWGGRHRAAVSQTVGVGSNPAGATTIEEMSGNPMQSALGSYSFLGRLTWRGRWPHWGADWNRGGSRSVAEANGTWQAPRCTSAAQEIEAAP